MKYMITILLLVNSLMAVDFEIKKVRSTYDGDTFRVDLNCSTPFFCEDTSIRVIGIDTPEIKGKSLREIELAKQAKAFTKAFLKNSPKLVNCSKDKYFRLDCYVIDKDGKSLSQELINSHLGVAYDGGTKVTDWTKF